jgi:multidrug efflux pump subunit AcrA (membrane-fusion protein)
VGWLAVQARWAKGRTDPEDARRHNRPIPVRTAPVEDGEVDDVIGATGVTAPSFTALIRLPPSGGLAPHHVPPITDAVLKAVNVHEGQKVKKGQILYEVEDRFFQTVLVERETAVAAAQQQHERAKLAIEHNQKVREKELASAEAELKFHTEEISARSHLTEMMQKLRDPKAVSSAELLELKVKLEQAQFERGEAKRRLEYAHEAIKIGPVQDREELTRALRELELAKTDLEETRSSVERLKVKSPIDGFVEHQIDVVAGQTVTLETVLARVVQMDPVFIRLDFPQERADDIEEGQVADVTLDSYPNEVFQAKVIRISSQVNTPIRAFPVVLEMPNPRYRIKGGVSCFARLHRKRAAKTVPSVSVIHNGGKAMVFRVEDGRAWEHEVRVGRTFSNGTVEVVNGLGAGDNVVVFFGNFYRHWGDVGKKDAYLQDGDLVDADWKSWAMRRN